MKNWSNTKVTDLLKIRLPIIQAPMAGGVTTPELVAAVSNAGGLGFLGAGYMTANEIRDAIRKIRKLTDKPFGVNFFIPEKHEATDEQIENSKNCIQKACHELKISITTVKPPYSPSFEEQMKVILEEKILIFSFTFGIPNIKWIENLKNNGTLLIGTATSLDEAITLEKHAIDAVVVQGCEAGGHRGTFIGKAEKSLERIRTLIPLISQNVKIPVIAAGGIMTAKDIDSVLKLGAVAVQMGTAFLCCPESGIDESYKQLLLNTKVDTTTLTRAFSGKLARGLMNKFIMRMRLHEDMILDYPIQNALTSMMRKEAQKRGQTDFMSLWAGEGVFLCKIKPAAQLIREWEREVLN